MKLDSSSSCNKSVLPLPPNSGLPELGMFNFRSRINPTSMGEGWGERLCWLSSGLPWRFGPEHGVEDCEQLASDGDPGDQLGLSGSHQSIEEGLEDWIVTSGGHCPHEQRGTDRLSSASNEAFSAPLAGLACVGRQSGQCRNLLAVEAAKFWQIGHQGSGDDGPNTGDRSQQVFGFAPGRRGTHRIVDISVDADEFLLQCLDQPSDAFFQMPRGGALLALPFGADHLHDLTPSRHQIRQQLRGLVRQRPGFGTCCRGKASDHRSVDRIGFGTPSQRLGKGADLRRIDNGDRKPRAPNRCSSNGLEPTRGLQHHNRGRKLLRPGNQLLQSRAVAFHHKRLAVRINSNVQTVLRYVDTNCDDIHGDPSLPNRASHFAAQATVRVRWTDGRGTCLTHGLQRPWGLRTPVRHRTVYNTRRTDFRLTRGYGLSIEHSPSPGLLRNPTSPRRERGTARLTTRSTGNHHALARPELESGSVIADTWRTVEVVAVIPSAAGPPAAPGHVVLFLGVRISRLPAGAPVACGIRVDGRGDPVLRSGWA